MPYITGTIQPAQAAGLNCPRCWFTGPFIPYAALTFRCSRCEWPFTLGAATVAAPSVPATTVAAANTTGTVVDVNVSGGTVTAITVSGTVTGQTSGHVYVPVGGTISVTYSVAPTWTWALPVTSAGVSAGGTALPFTAWGTAFAAGQDLIVDAAGTPDVVSVTGTPTGTSVPVTALAAAHTSGKTVSVIQFTAALSGAGLENVPLNAY